jgi:hypothetical protein
LPEVLAHEGTLVPPGDDVALAQAIRQASLRPTPDVVAARTRFAVSRMVTQTLVAYDRFSTP